MNMTFDGGNEITATNIYPKEEAIATKVVLVTNLQV